MDTQETLQYHKDTTKYSYADFSEVGHMLLLELKASNLQTKYLPVPGRHANDVS